MHTHTHDDVTHPLPLPYGIADIDFEDGEQNLPFQISDYRASFVFSWNYNKVDTVQQCQFNFSFKIVT